VLTAETVALKLARVEPVGTLMDAGTVTEPLLLAIVTVWVPFGAGALRVTVQLSVAAPVMELDAQLRLLTETFVCALFPLPLPFPLLLP
jgi:hypothetical protein